MTFSVKYKALFSVDFYHLFYLNKGTEQFLSLSEEKKNERLLNYNLSQVFQIYATVNTARKMKGHGLVQQISGAQFSVWCKVSGSDEKEPFTPLADDLELTFLIKTNDPAFYNFTGLDLDNAQKLYLFANKKPASELPAFSNIQLKGSNNTVNSNFVLSTTGQQNELDNLTQAEKQNLFGLLKIGIKGDNSSLDITDSQGKIKNTPLAFEIIFDNRKTIWRYIFNKNQLVDSSDDIKVEGSDNKVCISKTEQPLTYSGFVSVEIGGTELPNPDYKLIKPDSTNNKIYSEIFIYT